MYKKPSACPRCGSTNIRFKEFRLARKEKIPVYCCKDCHRRIREKPSKRKFPEHVVNEAIELSNVMSLRDVAKEIRRKYGWKVSHVAISHWIDRVLPQRVEPCYQCLFMEELKARVCNPSKCNKLEEWLLEMIV